METLLLEGTEDTPKIVLDRNSKVFEISGRSLPEDVMAFYQPVLTWLDVFALSPDGPVQLIIKLEYFNTASSKLILDILMKLEELHDNGTPVTVNWYYDKQDADMQEAGEEYAELVGLGFQLVGY